MVSIASDFGVPDEARRAALDPAGGVDAVHLAGVAGLLVAHEHLALVVRDDPEPLVERDAGQRRAEVADGAVHGLHGQLADLAGADDAARAVGRGALPADAADAAVPSPRISSGFGEEVQVQAARGLADLALAPLVQHLVDDEDLLVARDGGAGRVVVVEVLVVDGSCRRRAARRARAARAA
jgi:hypothetical protein